MALAASTWAQTHDEDGPGKAQEHGKPRATHYPHQRGAGSQQGHTWATHPHHQHQHQQNAQKATGRPRGQGHPPATPAVARPAPPGHAPAADRHQLTSVALAASTKKPKASHASEYPPYPSNPCINRITQGHQRPGHFWFSSGYRSKKLGALGANGKTPPNNMISKKKTAPKIFGGKLFFLGGTGGKWGQKHRKQCISAYLLSKTRKNEATPRQNQEPQAHHLVLRSYAFNA